MEKKPETPVESKCLGLLNAFPKDAAMQNLLRIRSEVVEKLHFTDQGQEWTRELLVEMISALPKSE